MLALTAEMAKNIGLAVLAGIIVVGFLAIKVTKTVTKKAISFVVMLCFALGVWTQRTNVSDCASKVKDQQAAGQTIEAACTFFGQDVAVKVR